MKSDDEEEQLVADEDVEQWLPYHLIYENRSDEEELYAEYLTHFPWSLKVKVFTAQGTEQEVSCDTFFDSNCFYYKHHRRSPVSLGQGVQGIILDEFGTSSPLQLSKGCKIEITLDLGHECLFALYGRKSLTKVVAVSQMVAFEECGVIAAEELGVYCFFNEFNVRGFGLSRIFWSLDESIGAKLKQNSLVRPLPHFYGELAKTTEGCTYILSHDEFNIDLQTFILTVHSAFTDMMAMKGVDRHTANETPGGPQMDTDNFTLDSKGGLVDNNSNLQLRSCLWALGQIGSSKTGLRLLNSLCNGMNDINIIDDICILTKASPTLSTRGTCLYVLGLLSRTPSGMAQLRRHGFGFPADNLELDLAVAIPEDIDDFFEMATTHYVQSAFLRPDNLQISCTSPPALCRPGNMKPMDPNELLGKQGRTEETVLAHISSLCNNVTQKSSASALHRIRTKKASVFCNPLLFREALKLLNLYQFKLAAKRFVVFTLFDQVILDEEDAIKLFDESLEEPLLPFEKIRKWRFEYKKQLKVRYDERHAKRARNRHRQSGSGSSTGSQHSRDSVSSQPALQSHSKSSHVQAHGGHAVHSNTNHSGKFQKPHIRHQPLPRNDSGHSNRPPPGAPRNSHHQNIQKPPRQMPLYQVQGPAALPDEDEPVESLKSAVAPPPGSSMRSQPPPPLKTRAFDGGHFVKQKSNPPHKPAPRTSVPKNRAFSSKSDAAFSSAAKPPQARKVLNLNRSQSGGNGVRSNTGSGGAVARPKLANRSSFHNKPLPPGNFKGRNKKRNSGIAANRKVGDGIRSRMASLQDQANKNGFGGDYTGNKGQELADSPTDHVAGPNPLENVPSGNQY